ncbi:MAG: hypothetical protein Q9221_008285 [Calogaya cf. arnoldii]
MSKRAYSEESQYTHPRKKRVAFTVAKGATKTIIERNARESPLLRLPSELRDKIWGEVLGGELVHLDYQRYFEYDDFNCGLSEAESEESEKEPDSENEDESATQPEHIYWRHAICQHDCPENQPDKKKVVVDQWDSKNAIWLRPHQQCIFRAEDTYSADYTPEPEALPHHPTLNLTILRASRQIYVEANRILWTTNTFSFADGLTFAEFMKTRTIHQKRLINNLRIEMHWDHGDEEHWNKALNMATVRSLTSLRSLRLQVSADIEEKLWRHSKDRFVCLTSYADGLRKLSILPLTNVEVAVRASRIDHFHGVGRLSWQERFWDQKAREKCAADLKKLLLNPRGEEAYAENAPVAATS